MGMHGLGTFESTRSRHDPDATRRMTGFDFKKRLKAYTRLPFTVKIAPERMRLGDADQGDRIGLSSD